MISLRSICQLHALSTALCVLVRYETLEEGRRTYQPIRCDYNNKDEGNILSNKNHPALSQKLGQITTYAKLNCVK